MSSESDQNMELRASNGAQFFIQNEYCQVEVEDNTLIISSNIKEERIPFSVWSGEVQIERGIRWGTLTFYSNIQKGRKVAWAVKGLPWSQCRMFAREAVGHYNAWHSKQCEELNRLYPSWLETLNLLKKQPAYLADSSVYQWRDSIMEALQEAGITLEQAQQRLPGKMAILSPWLTDTEEKTDERNEVWIENERGNWEVLFSQVESSPLNLSQQHAVLLNNDNNLVLAGAGSGKTSVLTARIAYLLQGHLAQPEALLMLAFGKDAAKEMEQRIRNKIGSGANGVRVNTFHQLGLSIIREVEGDTIELSPLASDSGLKKKWCSDWLKEHWTNSTNFRRWQKHLSSWPVAYLKGDDELAGQAENPKLLSWLESQLDQLCSLHQTKKRIQQRLIDHQDYPRLNSELNLVWPCYQAWQQMLKQENQIDFFTMITRATEYVRKGRFTSPWRYIMVDEYQDISPDRIGLIEALCEDKKGNRTASLFAVGDDWQSIYQFAGSDVDLTTGFAERFASSSVHYLDTTYRFNSKLAEVANSFIQKNPNQLEKELESHFPQKQKSVFLCPMKRLEKELDDLNRNSQSKKSVLLLGRNHYHRPELLNEWRSSFPNLSICFMTCHASKGKEADIVFILSVDEGHFPATERQKHLSSALTESGDDFPHAEERRLFYVALTRAREKAFVMYGSHPSDFVNELKDGGYAVTKRR